MKGVSMEKLQITNGVNTISGSLFRPSTEGKHPAIIISHGYNGSHKDFIPHCEYFCERGFLVCAYDFCGGSTRSESTGSTTDMTITSEIDDLMHVYEYLWNLEDVDHEQIFLLGESQGGLVTALTAEKLRNEIKAMVLYYPALCIPDDWSNMYPRGAEVPERIDFWGMTLGRGFVEDVRKYDVFSELGGFGKEVLILHGDKDPIVDFLYSRRAVDIYRNATVIEMKGQGHGFEGQASVEAMKKACDFMEKQWKGNKSNG